MGFSLQAIILIVSHFMHDAEVEFKKIEDTWELAVDQLKKRRQFEEEQNQKRKLMDYQKIHQKLCEDILKVVQKNKENEYLQILKKFLKNTKKEQLETYIVRELAMLNNKPVVTSWLESVAKHKAKPIPEQIIHENFPLAEEIKELYFELEIEQIGRSLRRQSQKGYYQLPGLPNNFKN